MFLRTLGEMAKRTGIRVYGYALMDNHYHLVLEIPKANLVAGMQWFQTTSTQRFNVKNGKWGHLFGGRYKGCQEFASDVTGGPWSSRWAGPEGGEKGVALSHA